MKKLTLIAGAAAGYVLGARAGRERYDQIKNAASRARRNPQVQSVVDDVKAEATSAARKATKVVKEKVAETVRSDQPAADRTGADRTGADGPGADGAERFDVPPPGSTS